MTNYVFMGLITNHVKDDEKVSMQLFLGHLQYWLLGRFKGDLMQDIKQWRMEGQVKIF